VQRHSRLHLDCPRVQESVLLPLSPQVMGACMYLYSQLQRHPEARGQRRHRQPAVRRRGATCCPAEPSMRTPWPFGPRTLALRASKSAAVGAPYGRLSIPKIVRLPASCVKQRVNSGFMQSRRSTAAALVSKTNSLAAGSVGLRVQPLANQEDSCPHCDHGARRLAEHGRNAAP